MTDADQQVKHHHPAQKRISLKREFWEHLTENHKIGLKTEFSKIIEFERGGYEDYSHATDFKVLTKQTIRSMQATRIQYKKPSISILILSVQKLNWTHGKAQTAVPLFTRHSILEVRTMQVFHWDDCLPFRVRFLSAAPVNGTVRPPGVPNGASLCFSRLEATPGSRCQSVWPGHQS